MADNELITPAVPDLTPLQRVVDQWISATKAGYFSPLTNMAVLAEECGEVAAIMARLYGDQRPKAHDRASLEALADELVDVVWVVAALANQTGIDLTEALSRNIAKKTRRDSSRFA